MSRLEKWFLKRLCRKLVFQGNHEGKITEYYRILRQAAEKEFIEDNRVGLDDFLTECHLAAQRKRSDPWFR